MNSVHSTPLNTATTRSRECISTSQLPPVASVAPVTHTIGNLNKSYVRHDKYSIGNTYHFIEKSHLKSIRTDFSS